MPSPGPPPGDGSGTLIPCARAHLARFTRAWNWLPVALADELDEFDEFDELDEPHAAIPVARTTAVRQMRSTWRRLMGAFYRPNRQLFVSALGLLFDGAPDSSAGAAGGAATGSSMATVSPPSAGARTSIVPSCATTTEWTIESPSPSPPVPRSRRVKGSISSSASSGAIRGPLLATVSRTVPPF